MRLCTTHRRRSWVYFGLELNVKFKSVNVYQWQSWLASMRQMQPVISQVCQKDQKGLNWMHLRLLLPGLQERDTNWQNWGCNCENVVQFYWIGPASLKQPTYSNLQASYMFSACPGFVVNSLPLKWPENHTVYKFKPETIQFHNATTK